MAEQRVLEETKKTLSVLLCDDLLWIMSATRIKWLIGGFSFGQSLIYILKCFSFCDRRVEEFKVLKCYVNIFVLFVIERCVVQSILVEANLHPLLSCSQN